SRDRSRCESTRGEPPFVDWLSTLALSPCAWARAKGRSFPSGAAACALSAGLLVSATVDAPTAAKRTCVPLKSLFRPSEILSRPETPGVESFDTSVPDVTIWIPD